MRRRKKTFINVLIRVIVLVLVFGMPLANSLIPWTTFGSLYKLEDGRTTFRYNDAVYIPADEFHGEYSTLWRVLKTDGMKNVGRRSYFLASPINILGEEYHETGPDFLYLKRTDFLYFRDDFNPYSKTYEIVYDPFCSCTCQANVGPRFQLSEYLTEPVELEYTCKELWRTECPPELIHLRWSDVPYTIALSIKIVYYEGDYYFYLPYINTESRLFYRIPKELGEEIRTFYEFPDICATPSYEQS